MESVGANMSDETNSVMQKALCRKCEYILGIIDDGIINIRSKEIYMYIKGHARVICKGCGTENNIHSDIAEHEQLNYPAVLSEWTRRAQEKRYQKENK